MSTSVQLLTRIIPIAVVAIMSGFAWWSLDIETSALLGNPFCADPLTPGDTAASGKVAAASFVSRDAEVAESDGVAPHRYRETRCLLITIREASQDCDPPRWVTHPVTGRRVLELECRRVPATTERFCFQQHLWHPHEVSGPHGTVTIWHNPS